MFTAEITKTVKILVVATILLTVTFAQGLFAKEARDKGDRTQNNTSSPKAEKSAGQEKVKSPPASVQPTIREAPRNDTSMRPAAQPAIQQPQRQITQSPQQRSDFVKPQTRAITPLLNSQPTPALQQPVTMEPAGRSSQSRSIFRHSTTPSGVEVRQLSNTSATSAASNTSTPDKSRITTQSPDITGRGKATASSPPAVIIERPGNSRNETVKSIKTSTSSDIKTVSTDSPKTDSQPSRERNKTERTIDSDKTSNIAKAVVQPVKADIDKKPSIENKTTDRRSFFGFGGRDKTQNADKPDKSPAVKETQRSDKNQAVRSNTNAAKDSSGKRTGFIRSSRNTIAIDKTREGTVRFRPATSTRVIYEDRSHIRDISSRHDFFYRDRQNRLDCRIVWPSFYYPVCYDWGRYTIVHYVYPYYCHRFVFVSLGGYWPDYTCVRYYWYPAHLYAWYGFTPVAQEVEGDTYNYYTYNYYSTQETAGADYSATSSSTGITPVNADTFADVREKLNRQQAAQPDEQTTADTYFDEGVNAFGKGSYAQAEESFARAMAAAPDDMILPFAYGQALLAQGKYTQAAEILRLALQKSSPDKQGVYFPRGLYLDENTLMDQIDTLAGQAENNPSDRDLQLLLGYQLLGVGETEKAIQPLNTAKDDSTNSAAAAMLIDLAEKIKTGETQ